MVPLGMFSLGVALAAAAPSEPARVRSAIHGRVFLDRGRSEGFDVGRAIILSRRGRRLGRCVIDRASRRHSTCPTELARVGDHGVPFGAREEIARAPGRAAREDLAAASVGKEREAGPERGGANPAHVAAAREAFSRRRFVRARTTATMRAPPLRARASLSHASFARSGTGETHRQRIDVDLPALPLGFLGARGAVSLAVIGYLGGPRRPRFAPPGPATLLVFETALAARPAGEAWSVQVGRIRPRHAPGIPILDGMQVGLHMLDDQLELGVLAGGIPDPLRLQPSSDRWLLSLYGALTKRSDHGWLRAILRAGALGAPEIAMAADLEGRISVSWKRWLRLGAGARMVASAQGDATLASLRSSIALRLLPGLRLQAGMRWRDPVLSHPTLDTTGARHAHASARWRWGPIELGMIGGYGQMVAVESSPERGWLGSEVAVVDVLDGGIIAVGHQEGVGTYPGRTSWLRAVFPLPSLRFMARVAWYEDRAATLVTRDLGGQLFVGWRLNRHLRLRLSALGRVALTPRADAREGSLTGRIAAVANL